MARRLCYFFLLLFTALLLVLPDYFLTRLQGVLRASSDPIKVGRIIVEPDESWILETHRSKQGGAEWLYGFIPIFWKEPVSSNIYYVFRIQEKEFIAFFDAKIKDAVPDAQSIATRCSELGGQCMTTRFLNQYSAFFFSSGNGGMLSVPELAINIHLSDRTKLPEAEMATRTHFINTSEAK